MAVGWAALGAALPDLRRRPQRHVGSECLRSRWATVLVSAGLLVVSVACAGGNAVETQDATRTEPGGDAPAASVAPQESSPSTGESAATTPPEAPTSSAPPTPLSALTEWSDPIELPTGGDGSGVHDLVVHGGTVFAVGRITVDGVAQPAVWRSADSESWEVVDTTGLDRSQSWINRVISTDLGLVAIGQWSVPITEDHNDRNAIGWTSVDGVEWREIEALPATPSFELVTDLAVIGDSVWIAGYSSGETTDSVTNYLVGVDGTIYGPDATEAQRDAADQIVGWSEWGTRSRSFLIRSTDGTTWEDVALPGLEFVKLRAIAATAEGVPLLAGSDLEDHSALWRQRPDGTWETVVRPLPAAGTSVASLLDDARGLLVATYGGAGAVMAPDGAWHSLPSLTVTNMVSLDDRVVALGWESVVEDEGYQVSIAESHDAATWAAVQLPVNEFAVALVDVDDSLLAGGYLLGKDNQRTAAVWHGGERGTATNGEPLAVDEVPAASAPAEPTADLLRYDGTGWVVELANIDVGGAQVIRDLDDLDLSWATDLTVAGDGAVWVATDHGAYRLLDGVWTRFGIAEGLPLDAVRRVVPGPGASVVAATRAGFAVFDGERFVAPDVPAAVVDQRTIDLFGDGVVVWAATGSGLVSWDGSTWQHHGAEQGLPTPTVVGGELPAGIARRLYPTAAGRVIADFAGVGLAAWDGTAWTVLDLPPHDRIITAGPDGSIIYGVNREYSIDVSRWYPDGRVESLVGDVQFSSATIMADDTVWVTDNLFELYGVRDGRTTRYGELDGLRLGYLGSVVAFGDRAFLKGGSAFFVLDRGEWTAYIDVPGLGYPLSGSENSFSTGAVSRLAAGPDGTVWALTFPSLPEWLDTDE